MNKYKYLIKNVGLLSMSNFATKLLTFFLVPLYTSVLSTTEYGTYDLFFSIVTILVPVLTLNIQESVLRFALEKKYSREAVINIAFRYLIFSLFIIALGLFLNNVLGIYSLTNTYILLFFLMFFSQALSGILLAYIRGVDKIFDFSFSCVLASIVTIVCNILFLVYCKWGLYGYFLANIFGPILQSIYLFSRSNILGYIHLKTNYRKEKIEMVSYSKPLIANSIAWWINNAADRFVIVFFCGLSANGIYSVASKIPSILNIVQSIFNQAWTLSVVKDFDPLDKNRFFANTYRAYNCLLVIICSLIILFDKVLAYFLYANDFFDAWKYVPWLTIGIVFGALSGYIGGFFSAIKDTKIFAKSTVIGASLNIFLNIIATPLIGPLGAAIATAFSYCVVWIIRYWNSRKIIQLNVRINRDILSYLLLSLQSTFMILISNEVVLYFIEFALFFTIILLYKNDIYILTHKGTKTFLKRT